ncbi:hypothetical protein B0A50_06371 [Salinomyces thailandicus]|uniref:Large ribosomal subunit protein bL27m n=1 Tax=Salinomyces thailandicus TaxID=706561 RepID=A0A4U0TR28_9PEZI|nr:hypothetical protein B0A50_06371 [Salinomyces thailandica]
MPPSSLLAPRAPSAATLSLLSNALRDLRIARPAAAVGALQTRNASHQAQGRANKAKDGPGKRLGAKKTAGEYVVTGNILYKQRGTHWFAGDHCLMVWQSSPVFNLNLRIFTDRHFTVQGRDHTIHAAVPGYVRYYRDPARHPKRKYIGIVFDKNQNLPQPVHAVRRRSLGMLAYQMPTQTETQLAGDLAEEASSPTDIRQLPNSTRQSKTTLSKIPLRNSRKMTEGIKLTLRPGYQYRQSNHEIGRSAEKKEAAAQARGKTSRVYDQFKSGDRFAAWRKSSVRIARNNERRAMGRGRKGSGKRS